MALSTTLVRRLNCDTSDEPLTKRLKLAENVLYSSDVPIIRKEECIFHWLCNKLSEENSDAVWSTIYRCLAFEPKNFSRLSLETKNLLIDKIIEVLNEYPESQILDEMLKCCTYIFSSSNVNNYLKEKKIIYLMEAIIIFTSKVLSYNESITNNKFMNSNIAIECVEHCIHALVELSKQQFSEKKNLILIFIENILFPLTALVETIQCKKITSKIIVETQICIKKLLFGFVKNNALRLYEKNEKNPEIEESEVIFNCLKNKATTVKVNDVIAAYTCIFQCAVYNYHNYSAFIDTILRKLVESTEDKELSKQVLISLLKNSIDVSYNFDHKIEGVTLKMFLRGHIEKILSKKKSLKCLDYDLLNVIARLNPLIIDDIMQNILGRVLFENKIYEETKIARDNLLKELWKASVRLRRQQKFLSKFLITVGSYEEKEVENLELINKYKLPEDFFNEVCEDIKNRTTSTQIISMFHTLIFHLKSDCIDKFKTSGLMTQIFLSTEIVAKLLVIFFKHFSFLDSALPHEWQIKFYTMFTDLRNTLHLFAENICQSPDKHEKILFTAFIDTINIWCEVYDVLHYYLPNVISNELDFPLNKSQLKNVKQIVQQCGDQQCEKSLSTLLFQLAIYKKNQQSIKTKIIMQLWSDILQDNFPIIESFDEMQILKLTLQLINEAVYNENNLINWTLILKRNIPRMTKKFVTAAVLQIFSSLVKDIEFCTTKTIIETVDFEAVLKSLDDPIHLKETLKDANQKIAKQDFMLLEVIDSDKVKRHLLFLSSLPVSFLDVNIRTFLFSILYTFEEEIKNITNFKDLTSNLYSDFIRQNDINILNNVSNQSLLINHFKDNQSILSKLFKLSLSNISAITFWEDFIHKKEYDRKINSILLTCIDSSKSKASSAEHKSALHNLSLKLSKKIIKEFNEEITDPDEVSGLRISLKIILLEKKKLKDNLKQCADLTLKNAVKNPEEIVDNKFIQEILQLSLILLSQREHFDINEEAIQKLCNIFIKNPDTKIFSHFLEILKDNEFEYFAKSLKNQTKESLMNGDITILERLIKIWESLSKAETKVTRSKLLCLSVNNLFNDLLSSEINEISSLFLIKLFRAYVTSKRMIRLTDKMVDSIFTISMECISKLNKDIKLTVCQEALGLCLDFLRSKPDFMIDRLPTFNNLFRKIFWIILQEAKETNFSDEQMLRILAVDIEKFCTFFAKLKKDVARISPYLIADILKMSLEIGVLPYFLKVSLESSISHLLSNCDRHAISFLSRTLPSSTQQVFKTIYDNYTKYHKFTGKI